MLKLKIVFVFLTFAYASDTNKQNTDINNDSQNSNHLINTRHSPQGQHSGFENFGAFGNNFNPFRTHSPGNPIDYFGHHNLYPSYDHHPHHQPLPHHQPPLPNYQPPLPHHHPLPPPPYHHPHGPFLEPHIHNPTNCGHQFNSPDHRRPGHTFDGRNNHDRSTEPNFNNIGNNFEGQKVPITTTSTETNIPVITTTFTTILKPDNSNAREEDGIGLDVRIGVDDNNNEKNQTISVKS